MESESSLKPRGTQFHSNNYDIVIRNDTVRDKSFAGSSRGSSPGRPGGRAKISEPHA
jgi:hypothetical protein